METICCEKFLLLKIDSKIFFEESWMRTGMCFILGPQRHLLRLSKETSVLLDDVALDATMEVLSAIRTCIAGIALN